MSAAYTDDDVQAGAHVLNSESAARGRIRQHADRDVRLVLAAVAPAIAARAVRQAASTLSARLDAERISRADLFSAMSAISDEIERTH
jgi:hypothetical protein